MVESQRDVNKDTREYGGNASVFSLIIFIL